MDEDKCYWLPIFLKYHSHGTLIEVLLENGDKLKGKVLKFDDADGKEETLVVMEVANRDSMWNRFTFDEICDVNVLS